MAEDTTRNTAGEEATPSTDESAPTNAAQQAPVGQTAGENAPPSTVEEQAPSVVSEHLHSTSEPVATDIPTANAPDPSANLQANPEEAAEKGTPVVSKEKPAEKKSPAPPKGDKPAAAKAAGDKPAAAKAAKKEKAPAVEDKPFAEFMQQDYLPALKAALAEYGVKNLELTFAKQKVPIAGFNDECWQIIGRWQNGVSHQFNLYFPQENIQGQRAFSCNEGLKPSTIEPFLIDERKITLDLMVFGVLQRLNGQKWLALN